MPYLLQTLHPRTSLSHDLTAPRSHSQAPLFLVRVNSPVTHADPGYLLMTTSDREPGTASSWKQTVA